MKPTGSGEAPFQAANPHSHGSPRTSITGTHSEASQSSFLPPTSASVLFVSILTAIHVSHGGVLVLTPVDEQEGSQDTRSVEGRHLFLQVASGLNGESASVRH